jgi:hypothetical protein
MQLQKYNTAGNNLSEKLDNGKKIKDLINKAVNLESGYNCGYPYNFIIDILFNATIVKIKGEKGYYLKNYSYKNCLSKFNFLDDPNFIQAIKLTTRKNIQSI